MLALDFSILQEFTLHTSKPYRLKDRFIIDVYQHPGTVFLVAVNSFNTGSIGELLYKIIFRNRVNLLCEKGRRKK